MLCSIRQLLGMFVLLGCATSGAEAQISDADGCPNVGTHFVPARAEVNTWISCTSATIRVNGITVSTANTQPGGCPILITYYPAHYEAGQPKMGFRLSGRSRAPITVFRYECVASYILFLYLGESCDYSGRFQSGYIDSWDEDVCVELPKTLNEG